MAKYIYFLEFLSLLYPIIVLFFSIFNLILGISVFRFNKRNSYSKVSLVPLQIETYNSSNNEIDINFRSVFEKYKKGEREGFPEISLSRKYKKYKVWKVNILNRGDFASTNIKIEYSIRVKKAEIEYNKDEQGNIDKTNFKDYKILDFLNYNQVINIPYLGADQEKEIHILTYDGEYPEADLIVHLLTCDQNTFIKKPIKIDTIVHNDFDNLEDSVHLKKMLGIF